MKINDIIKINGLGLRCESLFTMHGRRWAACSYVDPSERPAGWASKGLKMEEYIADAIAADNVRANSQRIRIDNLEGERTEIAAALGVPVSYPHPVNQVKLLQKSVAGQRARALSFEKSADELRIRVENLESERNRLHLALGKAEGYKDRTTRTEELTQMTEGLREELHRRITDIASLNTVVSSLREWISRLQKESTRLKLDLRTSEETTATWVKNATNNARACEKAREEGRQLFQQWQHRALQAEARISEVIQMACDRAIPASSPHIVIDTSKSPQLAALWDMVWRLSAEKRKLTETVGTLRSELADIKQECSDALEATK